MGKLILLLTVIGACGFPRPADVKSVVSIGGAVHGMWSGVDGVALRLTADGVDTLYTVTANGSFTFPTTLVEGSSYVVAIAANPTKHTCSIAAGANGLVTATDVTSIEVACVGPAVSITLSAPEPWTFDPTADIQPVFNASLLLQEVALTIESPADLLTSAAVARVPVTLGTPSAPQALSLGRTAIDVDVTAQGGLTKTYQVVIDRGARIIEQAIYGKASNTGAIDQFGVAVALSGDTLAVGAYTESGSAIGVNGDQRNKQTSDAGAVYVFQRTGTTWAQQAYIKASNTGVGDFFGSSVALSGDTLAVGAPGEASSATGINSNQLDNSAAFAGAVYIFQRTGTTWAQQAYLKASNTAADYRFGNAVALSGDTLAVGAYAEDSAATGVNGNQFDNSASDAGAVYIFQRTGATWAQQAYIKASNSGKQDHFGISLALASDTLAVGATGESSGATGVNGDQGDNSAIFAGAVYVFRRNAATWAQEAYIKASNTETFDGFGCSVALFNDTLVIGAVGEDSGAIGADGNQADNSASSAGAVYVFQRTGTAWAQQAYLKAANTGAGDQFGFALGLFEDTLAVGAFTEASSATGVNGNGADNGASGAGAVYIFRRTGTVWAQQAYVKASNTGANDRFGAAVAISGDSLAVGAYLEASSATGIDGNQADNGTQRAGAVYLFR